MSLLSQLGATLKAKPWPSPNNGSITITDAIKLLILLIIRYPIDRHSDVRAFENEITELTGVRHIFSLGAGRMALFLLLNALNLQPDDEIILPGYTCVVMPNAIRFAGCKPIYVDIKLSDFNIDPDKIEDAITSKTRAILLQHTFGIPADIDRVREICSRRSIFLIEDAAHALGATYQQKPIGQWGDAVIFSTEASKMISTDKGGILATNNAVLADKIRDLYSGIPRRPDYLERIACLRLIYQVLRGNPILIDPFDEFLRAIFKRLSQKYAARHGLNFPGFDGEETKSELEGTFYPFYPRRLSGILCKVGSWQIKRLKKDIAFRREKAAMLDEMLPALGAVTPVFDKEICESSYLNFPIIVDDREKWRSALRKLHIWANGYLRDPLEPPETSCHAINGYVWGACPNGEFASSHIINIPLNRTMTKEMINRLLDFSL